MCPAAASRPAASAMASAFVAGAAPSRTVCSDNVVMSAPPGRRWRGGQWVPPPTPGNQGVASAGGGAVGAGADEVEPVVVGGEGVLARHPAERPLDLRLDPGRHGEVPDLAAGGADEVVVVPGEVLGQLVAGELVGGDDPVDDPGPLQHGEVAVGRRLGQRSV